MEHVHNEHPDETSRTDDGDRQFARPEGRSDVPAHAGDYATSPTSDVFPSGPIYGPDVPPHFHLSLTHQELTQYFPDPATAKELKTSAPEVYAAWIETTKETIATDNYMRRASVDNSLKVAQRGQTMGLIAVVAVLILAGFCAFLDHPWLAGFLCTVDLVALAAVFNAGGRTTDQQQAP